MEKKKKKQNINFSTGHLLFIIKLYNLRLFLHCLNVDMCQFCATQDSVLVRNFKERKKEENWHMIF